MSKIDTHYGTQIRPCLFLISFVKNDYWTWLLNVLLQHAKVLFIHVKLFFQSRKKNLVIQKNILVIQIFFMLCKILVRFFQYKNLNFLNQKILISLSTTKMSTKNEFLVNHSLSYKKVEPFYFKAKFSPL
jgi:hypothetical protein